MKAVKLVLVSIAVASLLLLSGTAFAQAMGGITDPGVQAASRGTGKELPAVADDTGLQAFFNDGLQRFQEIEGVNDPANPNVGLGPRFNFNQCAGCHAQPSIGGTGPAVNPQFAGIGTCNGVGSLSEAPVTLITSSAQLPALTPPQKGVIACNTTNTTPAFITANGPTREARFPFFFNADGSANTNSPNGGVEDLFVVSGRPDGGQNCSLPQPSFAEAAAANNLIFRIPTPLFGAGLVENLDDSTLLNNQVTNLNNNVGVTGTFNHNGNDGTISRFGWKAQNKSLQIFAGEAYNVEMGISNLLFTQDRPLPGEDQQGTGLPASCLNLGGQGYPEDANNPDSTAGNASVLDDVSAFADFMRLLAPPPTGGVVLNGTAVPAATIAAGEQLFISVGCSVCHNPTNGNTQASNITGTNANGLGSAAVNSFSDFEIHDMGTGLQDNVSQGGANGTQFRTAPLWGLGQRIFLLHDGRTTNLVTAINDHGSNGSEANTALDNAAALSITQQQELLDFLRSL
jgi:CxxC motif-containing protein (DUF1111 family)